jgi:hypothetical protein
MRSKTYKHKGDISYQTFSNFSEIIDGDYSEEFIVRQTIEYFNPVNLVEFERALRTMPDKITLPYKIDLDFDNAGKFIDCDTFISDGMVMDFLKLVVKPKYFFSRAVNFDKINVAQVEVIIGMFNEVASKIKEGYEWIYNPPNFGGVSEITQGSEEREDFAKQYGGYMEMTYLIAGGDVSKFDKIVKWSLDKYLFLGEYCLRKRTVENLK